MMILLSKWQSKNDPLGFHPFFVGGFAFESTILTPNTLPHN
jgi:hypothetical protein